MRIPINDLKKLACKCKLDHIIVFATEGKEQHIATYGRTIEECSQAAFFGNKLKDALGWPEQLRAEPLRVKKLQRKIKELENEIQDMKDKNQVEIDMRCKRMGHVQADSPWPRK